MLAFATKQRATRQTPSAKPTVPSRTHVEQSHEANSILHLQRTLGNQAAKRMLPTIAEELEVGMASTTSPRFAHNFSRIPVHPPAMGAIQTKLAINKPGDEYEQEADRISEQVMRMPDPQLQRACACGGECPKCRTNLAHENERLQPKQVGAGDLGQASVPPIVHGVLRSAGQPLDAATQSFMSPRFGFDFSDVRIHMDATADESALAVNALAYTVGRHVVFGAHQYQPGTRDGRRLLAHELAHVVQQNQARSSAIQRACRSPAQCVVPSLGNAAQFGTTVEAESEAIAVASGGVPAAPGGHASCNLPRHGQRATNLETLATTAGLGATIAPGIAGFFINACLSSNDGATNAPCSKFPGGPPAHTLPDEFCVQIHTTDEDQAIALLAKPRPLGDADLRNFLWNTASVAHESQHRRFDADPAAIVPPAVDCSVDTPVPVAAGASVGFLLSEISAEIAEFDVYFRNSIATPGRSSTFAMQSEEHNIASRGGENILGNIRDLQCACNCSTVDTFVEQVFNQASSTWSVAEKQEFNRAMTSFLPSFWPRSLHQR